MSFWIKRLEWHGISLWAGFFFSFSLFLHFFLFIFIFFIIFIFSFSHTYRHAPLDYLAYASPSLSSLSLSLSREIIAHVWTAGPTETSLVAKRVKPSSILRAKPSIERERVKTTMNKDVMSVWTGLG